VAERAAAAAQVVVDDVADPALRPDDAHHLARVLRLRPGELVIATDGRGHWVPCRYLGVADRKRSSTAAGSGNRAGAGAGDSARALDPVGPVRFEAAPHPVLTVAFAPVKGDRPEWVVQKLTELGVDRIVPLVTARSVVRWDGPRAGRAVDRLRRVAADALGQCRRVWLPDVTDVTDLDGLGQMVAGQPSGADSAHPPRGVHPGAQVALAQLGGPAATVGTTAVAVGPEGGWSPEELATAPATVGLGPLVLRAETAAMAAGAILAGLRAGTVVPEGRRPG